jgi:hypothetical protein
LKQLEKYFKLPSHVSEMLRNNASQEKAGGQFEQRSYSTDTYDQARAMEGIQIQRLESNYHSGKLYGSSWKQEKST